MNNLTSIIQKSSAYNNAFLILAEDETMRGPLFNPLRDKEITFLILQNHQIIQNDFFCR